MVCASLSGVCKSVWCVQVYLLCASLCGVCKSVWCVQVCVVCASLCGVSKYCIHVVMMSVISN